MICPRCRPWAAITPQQLNNRLRLLTQHPDIGGHVCKDCGTADWMTTTEMVVTGSPLRRRWWQQLGEWFKLR